MATCECCSADKCTDGKIFVSCHVGMSLTQGAVVAEWLRRLTRNQFPSGSVGSNPTDCEKFNFFVICLIYFLKVLFKSFFLMQVVFHNYFSLPIFVSK